MSLPSRLLSAGGLLAQVMPERFEHRPEQLRFAEAAARTLQNGGVLLAEAGTGTGKTLAYLSAAVDAGRRVVVSTGTRALQDQIVRKDIPLLERALKRSINAACLKGLSNYLCLRRLEAARGTSPFLDDPDAALLAQLESWSRTTQTGDRAELEHLPADLPLWQLVCAGHDTRIGPKCPFFEECFVTRARAAAQGSDIVIINHHLFFADLALRSESQGSILSAYDALVFDEAHQIDAIATEFFGYRVSMRQVDLLVSETRRGLRSLGSDGLLKLRDAAEQVFSSLLLFAQGFFRSLPAMGQGRSELDPDDLSGEVEASYWRFDSALEAFSAHLSGLPTADEPIRSAARRATVLRDDLAEIVGRERRAAVYWCESSRKTATAVGASPIDVSEVLRERVFYEIEGVVLTSATLTVEGKFTYIKERLGIDFDAGQLVVPSPFDYRDQAALFLPHSGPDPRGSGYVEAIAELVLATSELVSGGTLVLFTSNKDMRASAGLVRSQSARQVLVQGERPRHTLLGALRDADEPMILFATASFWEGVDLPGEALELLIITRLPFASPSDPIVAARLRHLQEQGRNGFAEYQIPQAALSLKQGFGRLIRSKKDRGIVAVVDRRLMTMGYGAVFLRTLPRCTQTTTLEETKRWWTSA